MGEPIYNEEYAGTNICEVFEEEVNIDQIYDDEYGSDDIHEVLEKEEKYEPIYDEEYIPSEYGESLEVKRSMQTTTDKEESWLKHNILHTSNTSQGKVCDIIINSGSCESVVLNDMVENLKLPTNEHQDPYKLQWLNKDNKGKVSQHSIIPFSIGNNYKENLLRDVISMDTRRPCKYDHRTLYDCYANTCIFVKDVIEIKLAPQPLNEFNDGKVEFKLLGISLAKESFKDKTKLHMSRLVPKPPWEDVIINFTLGLLWIPKHKEF